MANTFAMPKDSCWSPGTLLLTASTVAAVAVAASPFVFPLFGVGELDSQQAFDLCTTNKATGLAGWSSNLLSYIPYVGETLAKGGIWNGVAGGAIGLSGTWIAGKMQDSKSDCTQKWGTALRVASLVTTALIALPALLPALSMGVNFLSFVFSGPSTEFTNDMVRFSETVIGKLGEAGAMGASSSGAAFSSLLVPHLLSCGVGGFLAAESVIHSSHKKKNEHDAPQETDKPTQNAVLATPSFIERERLRAHYRLPEARMA